MIIREEVVGVEDGTGRIRVEGDGWASALFVDGRAVLLNWCDCQGSVGQEFSLIEGANLEASVKSFRSVVEDGPDPVVALASQIAPLLGHFRSGRYRLILLPLTQDDYGQDWEDQPYGAIQWYYPNRGVTLLPTQPNEALDQERVLWFEREIAAGRRPVVITAGINGGVCEFVLDGHHKQVAYGRAGVQPIRLCILGEARPLSADAWPDDAAGAPPRSWKRCMEERGE